MCVSVGKMKDKTQKLMMKFKTAAAAAAVYRHMVFVVVMDQKSMLLCI